MTLTCRTPPDVAPLPFVASPPPMLPLAYLIPAVLAFSLPLDSHPPPACFGSGVSLCWNVLPPEFQKASFPLPSSLFSMSPLAKPSLVTSSKISHTLLTLNAFFLLN